MVVVEARRSVAERLFQAVLFELLAVLACTPLFAWIMEERLEHMGALTIANSLVSTIWIAAFNAGADRLRERLRLRAGASWRIGHAVAYELTLFLFTVPLAMWWLDIGIMKAVLLDMGLVLFFIPYTSLYHWGYDVVRERVLRGRAAHGGSR